MSFLTSTPTIQPTINKRSIRNHRLDKSAASLKLQKKQIVHRIFEDATEFTSDFYWKNLLFAASRNEFPQKSIYFDGEYLHKTKNRGESIERIPVLDPEKACQIFIEFHQKHITLLSHADLDTARERRDQGPDEDIPLEWINCAKRFRQSLLCTFAKKLASDNQLSESTRKSLEIDLLLLSNLNLISSKNITIFDNEISQIDTLVVYAAKDSYIFTKDLDAEWQKKLTSPKTKKKKLVDVGCIAATYNVSISGPKDLVKKPR